MVLPETITRVAKVPDNIGGDIQTMIFHMVFWWVIFILIEQIPKGFFERGVVVKKKDRSDLDCDVLEEETRVATQCQSS